MSDLESDLLLSSLATKAIKQRKNAKPTPVIFIDRGFRVQVDWSEDSLRIQIKKV